MPMPSGKVTTRSLTSGNLRHENKKLVQVYLTTHHAVLARSVAHCLSHKSARYLPPSQPCKHHHIHAHTPFPGSPCLPRNITSTNPTRAFLQDRRSSPPPASNEIGGLVQRRSTDSGATWSEPETLYSGNLDFYTVVRDAATSKLWLMLQEGSAVQVRNPTPFHCVTARLCTLPLYDGAVSGDTSKQEP